LGMLCALTIAALAALPSIVAQTTGTAQCVDPNFAWTFNSLSQSPCQVAEALGGTCNSGQFTVGPLLQGNVYLGPTLDNANSCRCSSVFYSLISACASCQDRNFLAWSRYQTNCSTVYVSTFSQRIPPNTAVPNWAYEDVTVDDNFNATRAQSDLGPETTGVSQTTRTGGVGPSGTPTTAPPSKGSSAGPIAGGVVGGIVGLALIAGLAFWFIRRRRSQKALANPFNNSDGPGILASPAPMSYATPPPPVTGQAQKLYDPADPSTFPTSPYAHSVITSSNVPSSPAASGAYDTYQDHSYASTNYNPHPQHGPGHNYTGAPEV